MFRQLRPGKVYVTHLATTYDALVLIVSEGAFVADSGKRGRTDVAVADWTLPITLVAEASDGNACLLAAHNQITEVYSLAEIHKAQDGGSPYGWWRDMLASSFMRNFKLVECNFWARRIDQCWFIGT